jgi:hypothetical protein
MLYFRFNFGSQKKTLQREFFFQSPYAGLSFASFDRIKHLVLKNNIYLLTSESTSSSAAVASNPEYASSTNMLASKPITNKKYYELTVVGKLACGAITGVVTQTCTYPIDVVRRYMQLATMIKDASLKE